METDREGWSQEVREYWAVRRGVSAEPSSPFVVVGAGYVLVVVVVRCRRPLALSSFGVVRWHCHWRWRCPWALALSVGIIIGVGVVHGRWRRPLASSLALALSVGVVIGVGVVCWLWRCLLALALSVGIVIGVGIVRGHWRCPWALSLALALSVGVGVVRWRHWRCPLALSPLSVGVVVVHWLVNGCERTWALVTVMGASGMGWSGVACRRWWCWLVSVASPVDVVVVVVVEEETASQHVTLALC